MENVTWLTRNLVGFLMLVTVKDQFVLEGMFERGKLLIVIIPVDATAVHAAKVFY